jgi:hypothetical protein
MACCAALTLIFSWGYRCVRWAIPHEDDTFAPAASWPPVGGELATPASSDSSRRLHDAMSRACLVVGITWFVAGILAMHVLGVVAPIRSLPADVVFHASGLWLATAGLALRVLPARRIGSIA